MIDDMLAADIDESAVEADYVGEGFDKVRGWLEAVLQKSRSSMKAGE